MIRLGITGGIGSGKSLVSALLAKRGIDVYDCDSKARAIMQTDAARSALTDATGIDFYIDGQLDKRRMADYLFSSERNARIVDDIVHPLVRQDFAEWCRRNEQNGSRICAMESAILFEAGMKDAVDAVVVVDAPERLRLERVMKRDSVASYKVEERIRMQMPQEQKVQLADYVICNDGDEINLERETDALLDRILNDIRTIN